MSRHGTIHLIEKVNNQNSVPDWEWLLRGDRLAITNPIRKSVCIWRHGKLIESHCPHEIIRQIWSQDRHVAFQLWAGSCNDLIIDIDVSEGYLCYAGWHGKLSQEHQQCVYDVFLERVILSASSGNIVLLVDDPDDTTGDYEWLDFIKQSHTYSGVMPRHLVVTLEDLRKLDCSVAIVDKKIAQGYAVVTSE